MFNGGVVINPRTAQVIRLSALLMPLILLAYGFLIKFGIVDRSHYVNDSIFYVIVIPWLVFAAAQYVIAKQTRYTIAFRVGMYHLLSSLYILFVSGFAMPFIAAWILLFLSAYAYFSLSGLRISVALFALTGFADIMMHFGSASENVVTLMAVVATLAIGLSIATMGRAQEVNNAEFTRTKAEGDLQRDRVLTIVNNLADGVLSTDKNGIVRVYNAALLNLLDTNESPNGHHIDRVLTLRTSDGEPMALGTYLTDLKATTVRDDIHFDIEGESIRLELTASPIRGAYSHTRKAARNDGYVIILRDITKSKSLEEERDEFISVVSHELRTPITVAEGTISNVQLMLSRPGTAASVLKGAINTAHEQVIFLAKMVNDLSTLSRAERGVADQPELINVRSLATDLYKEYAPQARKKKLTLDLDIAGHLGHVTASPLYLKELLQNFVTNAIKYTKEGTIVLRIERSGDELVFSVKDSGIGISKTDQAKVFDKFYRSEDYRTRETGGTGLGLYVAAKLAKKLGTQIELKSRLNHGSTFSFTLPVDTTKR